MNRFPTGEEKELELWCRKCKAFTDEKHGCKDCKKCGTDTKCKHCKGDIAIRNPKGFCDHLYYPEYCEVCRRDTKMKPDLWEEEFDENVKFDEAELGGNWSKQDVKNFIRDLLAQKEAKKEEQHRKELEGLRIEQTDNKYWMTKLEVESSDYSYGHTRGWNLAVNKLNTAITNLLDKGEEI